MDNLKSALITGATGAIGKSIARLITEQKGYRITILARDENKAQKTVEELKKNSGNPFISYVLCNLSRKQQIRELVANWEGPLHLLVNNAGVTPRRREETPEGIEMQWATNVLGYFWMMKFFAPILEKSAPARIVNVASYWAGDLDMKDLEFKHRFYDNNTAYRQSKQANRMLTAAFAISLLDKGITVNACHPGDVRSTLASNLGFGGSQTPDQGAATPVWLATAEELSGITGKYFEHLRESPCRFVKDSKQVEKLYEICGDY